jgi:hypothetical protein
MGLLNTTELARQLNLSKGRISQLAGQGRLAGCYTGDGRERRYDLGKVVAQLKGTLDPGQMLGNGAATQRAMAEIAAPVAAPRPAPPRTDSELPAADADGYQLNRSAKLAEELRRLRRQNGLEDGTLVLASEVERQVAAVLRQELAEIEDLLRTAARTVADRMNVDFRAVRKILTDAWRVQRASRSVVLGDQVALADMNDDERAADI